MQLCHHCLSASRFLATAILLFAVGLTGCDDDADFFDSNYKPGVLTGTVLNANSGAPAAGALVTLYPPDSIDMPDVGVRTNIRGEFRFENLPSGRYRITVEADELKDADEIVYINSSGTMNMSFRLPEIDTDLATLYMDAALDYVREPEYSFLRVRPEIYLHELDSAIRSNQSGYFEEMFLPAGELTISVRAAGFATWTETMKLRRGESHHRSVHLKQLDESEWVDGIVAWYPLNGDGMDFSGNGCDALVEGARAATGRRGSAEGAMRFNGFDAQLRVPHDGYFAAHPFSISLWLRTTATKPTQGLLSMIEQDFIGDSEYLNGFHLVLQDGRPGGWYSSQMKDGEPQSGVQFSAMGLPLYDNSWHHVVYIFGGDNARIYVDGMLRAEEEWLHKGPQHISPMDMDLYIGACPPLTGQAQQHFDGALDDLRLFRRELSASEVQVLFTN